MNSGATEEDSTILNLDVFKLVEVLLDSLLWIHITKHGVPFEPGDQDSIEDLLTITDQEKIYWEKRGVDPEYIYELAEEGWEEMV